MWTQDQINKAGKELIKNLFGGKTFPELNTLKTTTHTKQLGGF